MKNYIFAILSTIVLLSCSTTGKIQVLVQNPLQFSRNNDMVEIDEVKYLSKLNLKGGKAYLVTDRYGKIIPSQLTSDRKLIFPATIVSGGEAEYTVTTSLPRPYSPRVFGRLYPERKNDFSCENDRVGFRLYGDTLKYTDGPSNGLDLWLKRTSQLVLDEWYRDNNSGKQSFHVDHGKGCDPYAVGRSLGAGAMAPFVDGKLVLNENYLHLDIVDSGPLRLTAILTYPEIEIQGEKFKEKRTLVLDAGSQLTKIIQQYDFDRPMQVAAGIVMRGRNDSIVYNKLAGYFAYSEPPTDLNGQLFLGVFIPQGIDSVFVHSYGYDHPLKKEKQRYTHVLGAVNYLPGKAATYYAGYGWSRYGFEDLAAFNEYMSQFSEKIKNPLVVKVK
jgi:hypothetical protein